MECWKLIRAHENVQNSNFRIPCRSKKWHFKSVTLVGIFDDWPHQRGQWVEEKINSAMVDEPGSTMGQQWFNNSSAMGHNGSTMGQQWIGDFKLAVNKPVAKHGSVLATSVVHAEVVQWGHHLSRVRSWGGHCQSKWWRYIARQGSQNITSDKEEQQYDDADRDLDDNDLAAPWHGLSLGWRGHF